MIRRNTTPIRMRNYGRIIQDTIEYACTLTDPEQRQALTTYIAQCMRQKNLVWNRDQESGMERVKQDIHTLSNGRLDAELQAMSVAQQPAAKPADKQQPAAKPAETPEAPAQPKKKKRESKSKA